MPFLACCLGFELSPDVVTDVDVTNGVDAVVDAKEGRLAHGIHPPLLQNLIR